MLRCFQDLRGLNTAARRHTCTMHEPQLFDTMERQDGLLVYKVKRLGHSYQGMLQVPRRYHQVFVPRQVQCPPARRGVHGAP